MVQVDSTASPRTVLANAITAFEELNKRKTFVLVRSFDPWLPQIVERECFRVLGKPGETPHELDIILKSDGGSADAAYQALLIFRQFARHIRVFVPGRAKSAATLFCLGADEIVMSGTGELGPLDAQVIDPRNPLKRMSALDGYQSVEYIRDYALTTQNLAVGQMIGGSNAEIPLTDIIDHAGDFVERVVSPIMSQINPLDFGWWGRTLDIGRRYAEELLSRHGMVGREDRDIRKTAHTLVYQYPHHGYVIDLLEATEVLQLNASVMELDTYLAATRVVQATRSLQQRVVSDGDIQSEKGYTGFAPQSNETPPEPEGNAEDDASTPGDGPGEGQNAEGGGIPMRPEEKPPVEAVGINPPGESDAKTEEAERLEVVGGLQKGGGL